MDCWKLIFKTSEFSLNFMKGDKVNLIYKSLCGVTYEPFFNDLGSKLSLYITSRECLHCKNIYPSRKIFGYTLFLEIKFARYKNH